MATELQERLAEAIVENKKKPRDKRKNKGELLESVGYATTTAHAQPSREFEAKGVKESLAKYGLTEQLITSALVEDIKAKPQKRVEELKLGAEVLGMKEKDFSDKTTHLTVINLVMPHDKLQN